MYTRRYGRRNFLIKGYRSTKAKKRHSYFQPMSIIDVVFYYKEQRELQLLTESTNKFFFNSLQTQPVKITLGMVIMEVFHLSVREEEENTALFEFLKTILIHLEESQEGLIHLFVYYLTHLTRYLGFFPRNEAKDLSKPVFFDLQGGILENAPGARTSDSLIAQFCFSGIEKCTAIRFSNLEKTELINTLLEYYTIHVEGFRRPESLKVLAAIFR